MNKTETPFSQEYSTEINTSTNVSPQPAFVTSDMKIDVERYGTGKPKRIIIRAKLTND